MPALAHSGCAHGQAEAAPGDSTSSRAALMEELWRERTAAASLPAPKVVPPKSKSDLWRRESLPASLPELGVPPAQGAATGWRSFARSRRILGSPSGGSRAGRPRRRCG